MKVRPLPAPAISFSHRKSWKTKRQREWYREISISSFALGFREQKYFNDTVAVWSVFNSNTLGYPTVLFELGKKSKLLGNNRRSQLGLGLEGGYIIAHSIGGILSRDFGIYTNPLNEPSPFLLRFSTEYSYKFNVLGQIPCRLQLYAKLTPQLVTRGEQYLRNRVTGALQDDGKFHLNASELGLKFYTDIKKENFDFSNYQRKSRPSKRGQGPTKYRLSLDAQFYAPPATDYFVPLVPDSFSLTGVNFSLTQQVGFRAEFLSARNDAFTKVVGLAFGKTTYTHHFVAQPAFTTDGFPIDSPNGAYLGLYLMPNAGMGYRHRVGKATFQHTLLATAVVPIVKENESIQMVERSYVQLPPSQYPNLIMDGEINHRYGRDKVLVGLEYQPEYLIRLNKRVFYGLGLVFNYSRGIVGNGRVKITNGQTTYYGGLTQGFSKIGISFRAGWNAYDPRL